MPLNIKPGPFQETVTVAEAAAALRISRRFAYDLAKRGELPGVRRLGTKYVVSKKLLEDWLQGKTVHLPID
jgi:excisionase family DNA binding protein